MPMPVTHQTIANVSALTLPRTEHAHGRVDTPTIGATGRVWRLPFSVECGENREQVWFSGPSEFDAALSTCHFLRAHLPALFEEWREQILSAQLREGSHRELRFAMKALNDTSGVHDMLAPPSNTTIHPPQCVPLPEIGKEHWFRRRHHTVGNYIACSKDPARDSEIEYEQDYSCLKFYLSQYDTLAQTYSGEALFQATTWASFRDPYFSCMQMCLFDLQLPQPFMALVNHGIGAHLAMGQRFSTCSPRFVADDEHALLVTTREVFKEITRLFVEDFPVG